MPPRSQPPRSQPKDFTTLQPSIETVEDLVGKIMVDEFEVDPKNLRSDAKLVDDLDLDSLDGVDLVVALEKTFHCRIPEEEAKRIRTLGDIYDNVRALLQAQAAGSAQAAKS